MLWIASQQDLALYSGKDLPLPLLLYVSRVLAPPKGRGVYVHPTSRIRRRVEDHSCGYPLYWNTFGQD